MERRRPSAHSRRTNCSPTPSMSMAALTQVMSVSSPREGQARFGQRCIASPSGLTISAAQSGQRFGILNGFVPFRCSPAGPTICGITSPARWTITSSPSRMSLRLMSSSLCSVARDTVTPPTATGWSMAHGFSAPVRPTRGAILSRPACAGGGVARVRGELLVGSGEPLVQLLEPGQRHVDLPTHFDRRGHVVPEQPQGDRRDRAEVDGDVFPHLPVTARRTAYEDAVLVREV